MTEDEAKTKRCCGPDTTGQLDSDRKTRWCVGSPCMAWRWEDIEADDSALNSHMHGKPEGYCGLAGKP